VILTVAVAVVAAAARASTDASVEVAEVEGAIEPLLQALLALAWLIPSVFLVRRRPALAFGWLGLIAASAHAAAALSVASAPSNRWFEWAALSLIVVEVPILGAIVQLFPTGRPVEGWGWYLKLSMSAGGLGVVAAAVDVLPVGLADPLRAVAGGLTVPLLAFAGLGGVLPLAVRLRRSVNPERRAVAMLLVLVAVGIVVPGLVVLGGQSGEVAAQLFTVVQVAFVAVAVLRYRVWGLAPMTRSSLHRVVQATDAERRRIRAELHDGIGAGLTAVRLKIDAAQGIIAERPERATEMLASASADLGAAVDDVRRLVDGLRPAVLDRMSLSAALQLRAKELSASGSGLSVVVHDEADLDRLGPGADVAVYRLVTEALNNVVRHAGATRCEVTLTASEDAVVVEVVDDGTAAGGGQVDRGGVGRSSMANRAADVGGYVVAGPQPGRGYRVRAVIPVEAR
jgi:signal transduction histidine kinase